MIFRLKTSKRTQEIFHELENRTNYKPYTLVKHAIAWSLKENTSVAEYKSDSDGLDLNRQTITGDYETYFKVLIEQVEACLGILPGRPQVLRAGVKASDRCSAVFQVHNREEE